MLVLAAVVEEVVDDGRTLSATFMIGVKYSHLNCLHRKSEYRDLDLHLRKYLNGDEKFWQDLWCNIRKIRI